MFLRPFFMRPLVTDHGLLPVVTAICHCGMKTNLMSDSDDNPEFSGDSCSDVAVDACPMPVAEDAATDAVDASPGTSERTATRQGSWLVSILFWLTLLTAGSLYGMVALAPKLSVWMTLRANYVANQVQLVRLEDQVNYLKKVAHALEHDPHFTAEVARMEFRAGHANAESIPVDDQLSLSARTAPAVVERPDLILPWYSGLVKTVATNPTVRYVLMGMAAVLIVVSFTFLHDASEMTIRSACRGMMSGGQRVIRRYYSPSAAADGDRVALEN